MTKIACLGLGAMGSRIALNLIDTGFDVTVWNRDAAKAAKLAEKGAKIAATPRAAVAAADIAVAMVRDDAAARAVWLDPKSGALSAMRPGTIAIESSTLSMAFTRELAQVVAARQLGFLDAPVAGSRPQAEAKQLIYLVGGDDATLARAQPAFNASSAAVHHAGPSGAGMAMKLAVNALFGIQVAAIAELLGLLAKLGVNGAKAADILGATPVASPSAKGAMASMVSGAYAPLFPVELVAKDLGYALAAASDQNAQSPVSHATARVFATAVTKGIGAEHLTAVRKMY